MFMTVKDTAALLHFSERHVRTLIEEGRLRAERPTERATLVYRESVDAYHAGLLRRGRRGRKPAAMAAAAS